MGFIPAFLVPSSKYRINHSSSHERSKGKVRSKEHYSRAVVPKMWSFGPAATSASPGKLLEMRILGLHARPTEAEALGVGSAFEV